MCNKCDCEATKLKADLNEITADRDLLLKTIQEITTLLTQGSVAIAKLSASPVVAHLCMRLREAEKAEATVKQLGKLIPSTRNYNGPT